MTEVPTPTPEVVTLEPAPAPEPDKLEHILNRKSKQADEYKEKFEAAQKELEELKNKKPEQKPSGEYTSKAEFDNYIRDQRIDQFVTKNPHFSEFSETAKELAKTEQGQGLKTEAIFYAVAGEKLMEMGAAKAKATPPVNHGPVNLNEKVDFGNMDRTKFNELVAKARVS